MWWWCDHDEIKIIKINIVYVTIIHRLDNGTLRQDDDDDDDPALFVFMIVGIIARNNINRQHDHDRRMLFFGVVTSCHISTQNETK
jgi:hypothetical protein